MLELYAYRRTQLPSNNNKYSEETRELTAKNIIESGKLATMHMDDVENFKTHLFRQLTALCA